MSPAADRPLRRLASAPLFPWLFAAYPALQLAATNIFQIDVRVIARPLLFSWLVAAAGYLLLRLITRRAAAAAFLVLLGLLVFFSYGHLYQWLRAHPFGAISLGRHRYLLIGYAALMLAGVLAVRAAGDRLLRATPWANALSLALLIVPCAAIAGQLLKTAQASRGASSAAEAEGIAATEDGLPDVYYIILDTYTRGDALLRDYGYDNSWFLEGLEQLGFYVADCSRSNYPETLTSVTSALNLDYIPQIRERLSQQGQDPGGVFVLLKHSLVRSRLESLGYQTVAFQTGFDWSDLRDADLYFSLSQGPLDLELMSPFEVLFLRTTAVKLLLDTNYLLQFTALGSGAFKYQAHVELQRNILEELPQIPSIEGPTFTFAHLLIPHVPMVFEPDGSIVSDPGFYSGERAEPINRDYLMRGYLNGVAFVSHSMLEIVGTLIRDSQVPPVIIIQGDTGLEADNRMQILNVYYAPQAMAELYPSITPVNSFRAIFGAYFGTDDEFVPDLSYPSGDAGPVEAETAPHCLD